MNSNYKADEKILQNVIEKHVQPVNPENSIKLVIFYRNRKLKDMLIRNKMQLDRSKDKRHHVVYQYTCNMAGCSAPQYIGYTTCTLYDRFGMHTQSGSIKKHLSEVHNIQRTPRRELLVNRSVGTLQ